MEKLLEFQILVPVSSIDSVMKSIEFRSATFYIQVQDCSAEAHAQKVTLWCGSTVSESLDIGHSSLSWTRLY
jgi:hypothetical protein